MAQTGQIYSHIASTILYFENILYKEFHCSFVSACHKTANISPGLVLTCEHFLMNNNAINQTGSGKKNVQDMVKLLIFKGLLTVVYRMPETYMVIIV